MARNSRALVNVFTVLNIAMAGFQLFMEVHYEELTVIALALWFYENW
jgi:hypothetical protein